MCVYLYGVNASVSVCVCVCVRARYAYLLHGLWHVALLLHDLLAAGRRRVIGRVGCVRRAGLTGRRPHHVAALLGALHHHGRGVHGSVGVGAVARVLPLHHGQVAKLAAQALLRLHKTTPVSFIWAL